MKAVSLLSGGLDSATATRIAQAEGYEVHALTVVYGQRHQIEIDCAHKIAASLGLKDHRIANVNLDVFGGSALTAAIEVPKNRPDHEIETGIPVTYVPARNTVLLSLALAFAETIGANDLFIGVNVLDYSGYPDCRPEFLEAFETLANRATKAGVEGAQYKIHAPLLKLTKAEIIRKGVELGVDYGLTHSCYDPINEKPCGVCDACQLRAKGFEEAGFSDPALHG